MGGWRCKGSILAVVTKAANIQEGWKLSAAW